MESLLSTFFMYISKCTLHSNDNSSISIVWRWKSVTVTDITSVTSV